MKVYESLEGAKADLLARGWCQGTSMNSQGQVCLGGALGWVAAIFRQNILFKVAFDYVDREVKLLGFGTIPHFNDAIDTSFEDVINVLDRAILKAKENDE